MTIGRSEGSEPLGAVRSRRLAVALGAAGERRASARGLAGRDAPDVHRLGSAGHGVCEPDRHGTAEADGG